MPGSPASSSRGAAGSAALDRARNAASSPSSRARPTNGQGAAEACDSARSGSLSAAAGALSSGEPVLSSRRPSSMACSEAARSTAGGAARLVSSRALPRSGAGVVWPWG
jgi:hypothetical protein